MMGNTLKADTVTLKNGKTYTNVKAFPSGNVHRIQLPSRRFIVVPNAQIAKVRIKPVKWPRKKVIQRPIKKPVVKYGPPAREEKPMENIEQDQGLSPAWKSVLIPGWGQYAMQHKWRGATWLGAYLVALNLYWQKRQLHAAAQEEYSEQVTPALLSSQGINGYILFLGILEAEKATLLKREHETNNMVTLLSVVWGLNVIDALVLSRPDIVKEYPFLQYLFIGIGQDDPTQSSLPTKALQPNFGMGNQNRLMLGFNFKF
ncbi:MAG: hypothetical protein KDK39_08635 [Leptospiraceae bacterium]|nr:hypothetical protein [Leptospiraceae bacterium]